MNKRIDELEKSFGEKMQKKKKNNNLLYSQIKCKIHHQISGEFAFFKNSKYTFIRDW